MKEYIGADGKLRYSIGDEVHERIMAYHAKKRRIDAERKGIDDATHIHKEDEENHKG